MPLNKSLLLIFFLVITSACANAQNYYFKHYKVENGLSNNSVLCSLQDKNGFLWLGTKDGLNRFDGYTFKVFRNDPDDKLSIGNNFILSLHEDNDGVLWVGSNNGLYQYDGNSEGFSLLKGTDNEIRDIEMDHQGNIWFIEGLTIHKYQKEKKLHQTYPTNQFFTATSICSSPNGTIWVSSEDGTIKQYDPFHDSFYSYDVFKHSRNSVSKWIEEVYAINDTMLFIGTSNQGVKLFNTKSADYVDILTYNADQTGIFVRDFIKSNDQEYWIATESGIFIYNLKTKNIINLKNKFGDPYSVSDNAVYTLFKDREGGIWAGTYFGGINYYSKQFNSFHKAYHTNSKNSLMGNVIREFCKDQYGNLWIGTEDAGLNKLNTKTGIYEHYQPTGSKSSISYSNIHGLFAIGNELWIGTFEHGMDVMDIRTGKVIRHYDGSNKQYTLKNNFVHDIHLTKSGAIIIATARGLYKYNSQNGSISIMTEFPDHVFYTKILERNDHTLWVGTYREGVYYYNPQTGAQGNFKNQAFNKNSINGNRINDLYEDSNQNLWLATENGFSKYNPSLNNFTRYTTKEGLPSNVVYGILEDQYKKLWISTAKGLVAFNPADGEMVVYSKSNGLLSDQFNYNSAYKDADGRLYFGNVSGFISFQPSQFIPNTFTPPVYITGFQLNNKEIIVRNEGSPLKSSISYTKEIELKYNQSSFSIDFAALSFTAPEMTKYAYKLEGLNKDWTYLKTNRKVYFTELPPGTYTFKVKAAIFGGSWSTEEVKLVINILPPFWATIWAKCLYTLVICAILYYLVRSYHHRTEEKKEKEIYEAKIDFFTNVAHEIKTPLTLIKGPVDHLIESKDELPGFKDMVLILEKNTKRLLDLVTQILDFRQLEINNFSIDLSKVNVTQLLIETSESFQLLARKRNLHFTLDRPPGELFVMADEEALNKILSNLFSNAVKYASNTVEIKLYPLQQNDHFITIEFQNDGYMIPTEMKEKIFEPFFRLKENRKPKGTGIGLSLAKSLTELHQGDLYLKDRQNGMNCFILNLPLQPESDQYSKNAKIKNQLIQ